MTRTAQIILSDIPVRWDENHILIRIGCRNGRASASPLLLRMLAEVEAQIPSLIASRAVYTVVDHGETNGHPIFERAVQVALGIATIGPALEVQSEREFREGDLLRGLVLDAFGLSQPLVSHHLRTMREQGVLETQREGPFIFHQLRDARLLDALSLCAEIAAQSQNDARIRRTFCCPPRMDPNQ